jgi:hypothetical protein
MSDLYPSFRIMEGYNVSETGRASVLRVTDTEEAAQFYPLETVDDRQLQLLGLSLLSGWNVFQPSL